MNWNHFLIWLGGTYLLYYLAIMLWDSTRTRKPPTLNAGGNVLTFSEQVAPVTAADLPENENERPAAGEDRTPQAGPAITASGGVPLRDIFTLARQEAIVYTKQVSF